MSEDDHYTALKAIASKKLELVLTTTPPGISPKEVTIKLWSLGIATQVYEDDGALIARLHSIDETDAALAIIMDKGEQIGISATKRISPKLNRNEVKVFDTLPISATCRLLEEYAAKEAAFPAAPEIQYLKTRTAVFSMHPSHGNSRHFTAKKCLTCMARTTFKNPKTGDFFCSPLCHEQFYAQDNPAQPMDVDEPTIKGKRYVLAAYTSARQLVLREEKDQERFLRTMNAVALNAHAKTQHGRYLCTQNQRYIGYYRGDWYRARMVVEEKGAREKKSKAGRFFLPDLGIEVVLSQNNLRLCITDNPTDEPPLVHCTLADVAETGISYECEKLLDSLVAQRTPLVAVNEDTDGLRLQVDHVGGEFLAKAVNKALVVTVDNDGNSFFRKDLHVEEQEESVDNEKSPQKVPMVITDLTECPDGVGMARSDYLLRCYRWESQFQEQVNQSKGMYTPRNDELCLVRVKDDEEKKWRWLRAYGLLSQGDQYPRVELLDYGVVVKVFVKDIRKLPKELLYPAASRMYTTNDNHLYKLKKYLDAFKLQPVLVKTIIPGCVVDDKATWDSVDCPDMVDQIMKNEIRAAV